MQNIYKPVLTAFFALLLIVMADKAVAGGNQDVISDVVYVNSPNVIVDLSVLDDMMISDKPVKLVQPDGGKKPAQKLSSKPKAKAKAKTQAKKKAKKTSSAKPAKAKMIWKPSSSASVQMMILDHLSASRSNAVRSPLTFLP